MIRAAEAIAPSRWALGALPSMTYAAIKMGALFGGQKIPMSPIAPFSPVPVLSPARQSFGTPARKRFPPVSHFSSQPISRLRLAGSKNLPVSSPFIKFSMAVGLVVSRTSPGSALFKSGSVRSSRVTGSPSDRMKLVTPAGPPTWASSRLAAALSLTSTAAAQRSPTESAPSLTWPRVTGAYSSKSLSVYRIERDNCSLPASTRLKVQPASRNLKVLHRGKSSAPRWLKVRPVPVSSAATPSFTPIPCSIAANLRSGESANVRKGLAKAKPARMRSAARRGKLFKFINICSTQSPFNANAALCDGRSTQGLHLVAPKVFVVQALEPTAQLLG